MRSTRSSATLRAANRPESLWGIMPTDCFGKTFVVPEVSSSLVRLNVATRRWHPAADAPWQRMLRPTVTRADYLDHLLRSYGVIAPFESACKYTPGLARVIDFRELTRAGLIAQDLLSLGLTPSQVSAVAQCDSITPFHDVPEALGWLYVIERPTLLHNRLRRHLCWRMPELSNACAYMTDRDGEQWARLGRTLDQLGDDAESTNAIIAAARTAFETSARWFERHETTRRAV